MFSEFYRNLLIFSVYLLCVAYIFSKISSELQEFVTIEFDQESILSQLEKQNLHECVGVKFKLSDLYKPNQIKTLPITITNTSESKSIYVDWEQSTLTNLEGESRRLIRLVPGMNMDLSQPQVCGIVAPSQNLTEKIVAENSLSRNGEGTLSVTNPLFKPSKLQAAARVGGRFNLRLILELANPAVGMRGGSIHVLNCEFSVARTPWRRTIPW